MGDSKDLFKWKRLTKPKIYSVKSQKETQKDDIEQWLKKVEQVSNQATDFVFSNGTSRSKYTTPKTIKEKVHHNVEHARIHQAAYSEAQDLLDNWATEKLNFDANLNDEYDDDMEFGPLRDSRVKSEWDKLMDDYQNEIGALHTNKENTRQKPKRKEKVNTDNVSDIIQTLMDKDYVSKHVVEDLGMDNQSHKKPDPRVKMSLRHQQVKEKRLQRETDKKRQLNEKILRKEARREAEKQLEREDESRKKKYHDEENKIKEQMMFIRKQISSERKQKELELLKKKNEERLLAEKLKEKEKIDNINGEKGETIEKIKTMKRRLIQERLSAVEERNRRNNLKIMQKCFSIWYNVVLERRLKIGKAKAVFDWKNLMKTWRAWRSYSIQESIKRKSVYHQETVKTDQKKLYHANKYYDLALMRKCFGAWKLYLEQKKTAEIFEHDTEKTKKKISAFLQAIESNNIEAKSARQKPKVNGNTNDDNTINELFNSKKSNVGKQNLSARSSASGDTTVRSRQRNLIPKEAWQVTKKHVKMTAKQIKEMNDEAIEELGDDLNENSQVTNKKRNKNASTVVVGEHFHHRHEAQQKILLEQQKQLNEQKKLIEDLHYLQKQQMLQQKITGNQQTPDILQKHLAIMEKNLMELANNFMDSNRSKRESSVCDDVQSTTENESVIIPATDRSEISQVSKRHTDFLQTMEKRANERLALKKEREERKRREEKERIAKLELEAKEKQERELEDRKRAALEYKEKKKQEKLLEEAKLEENRRLKEMSIKADNLRLILIMKYRAWRPWRRLIESLRSDNEKAENFERQSLINNSFIAWKRNWQYRENERNKRADDFYTYNIKQRFLQRLKLVGKQSQISELKATRHYNNVLLSKCFTSLVSYYDDEKIRMWKLERIADQHNLKRMQLTTLRAWRRFPNIRKEQDLKNQRLSKIREKVHSLLPDYDPKKSDTPRSSIASTIDMKL